jgi:hypothetical protein
MAKKVPNPDGKKGGKDHQEKIAQVANEVEKRGLLVDVEYYVRVFQGLKNRFVDIAGLDKVTNEVVELHQIGKQNKDGSPVKRERLAIADIEKKFLIKVIFHPYNKIIILLLAFYGLYEYFKI